MPCYRVGAHVCDDVYISKRFARMCIAYMHLYDRHLALFDRIAERHGRMAVASCVEDDAGYII